MQTRALVKERSQRNLLLLIDGVKSQEMLLASVAGITLDDFAKLESLQLIMPAANAGNGNGGGRSAERAASAAPAPTAAQVAEAVHLDYPKFTATLTQLISSELGLRGFTLTLAVEKASSIEELREVANRVLEQIRERKGLPALERARRALYGS